MTQAKKSKKKKDDSRKQSLMKKCDGRWSKLVKKRAGNRCEVDGCPNTNRLNAHHLFSRNNFSTRFDLDNGICLCPSHHTLNSKFSAHKTPLDFDEWVKEKRWEERFDRLRRKANTIWDKDYEKVEKYLDDKEKELNESKNS